MAIRTNHRQRFILNNELHARPPEELLPPERISFMVLAADEEAKSVERKKIQELCVRFGLPAPVLDVNHFRIDLGPFRLKWERHTEFTAYTFFRREPFTDPFAESAIDKVPQDWLASLPGEVLIAAHVAIVPMPLRPRTPDELAMLFDGNVLTGSRIADGAAVAYSDFRIHADGFSRFLIKDVSLSQRQAGRAVQRLLEIEAYVMQALLAYPIARRAMPDLALADQQLAAITGAMGRSGAEDESALLDKLSKLASSVEDMVSATHYRIGAAQAYYALADRRIAELREERVEGMQTFHEFLDRRVTPAMDTCDAVARSLEGLSGRVARASELLRTRVDITLQRQNQAILSSMANSAKLQLRLQETVEGLSVAAITYYVVGLLGYVAKAAKAADLHVNPDLIMGIAIPVVGVFAALGIRYIRRSVAKEEHT